MTHKPTTDERIEELARAVKRGFDETASKKDVELIADGLDLVRADIHDIKITLGPLVRHVAGMERDMGDLKKRMDRVERKVGLSR